MKRITLIILSVTVLSTFAQSEQKAKTLLDQVYIKVKSYRNLTLDFDYVLDNEKENIHQETRGHVSMEGEKYHLKLSGLERIFDGNRIYTIDHEDEEVVISKPGSDDETEFTPSKILTFYKKGYEYHWDKLLNLEGKKIQFIKLVPIHKDDNKYILLGIDTKSMFINRVIYTANNGTQTTFKIRNYETDTALPEKEFTFDRAMYEARDYIITEM